MPTADEAPFASGSAARIIFKYKTEGFPEGRSKRHAASGLKLVALDMRGTLLNSEQRISEKTKDAIHEAIDRGFQIILATGKARSAAAAACRSFGLYGDRGVMSDRSAGVFMQGLDVYTADGHHLQGPSISSDVVRSAFEYASRNGLSIAALSGNRCTTLERTAELVDLHERCFDPLAEVVPSIDSIIHGPPIKKIIFLSDAESIETDLQPYWDRQLRTSTSQTMIAVSGMLEIIPKGANKWVGLRSLLQSMSLDVASCMAIGDGHNDYEMIKNVGIGIAMGNAVSKVKDMADHVVPSNDKDGIAEAIHKYLLRDS